MPIPDDANILSFESPELLSLWLEKNHDCESELYVKIFKKASKIQSVAWKEVVLECLCWGWIDGVKKSLDDTAYLQRITPRKPRSLWSKINTEHVENLIKDGRMREPGMAQVRAAKQDGRWENAYAPASQMTVPQDFIEALEKHPEAKSFYSQLNKSHLYVIAYGLESAKKQETRERRFNKFLTMLQQGEKPDFGFNKK